MKNMIETKNLTKTSKAVSSTHLDVYKRQLVLLSLLGTVAHASGLVADTVNADNLYSKYPLSNYQLDFYVDNSW